MISIYVKSFLTEISFHYVGSAPCLQLITRAPSLSNQSTTPHKTCVSKNYTMNQKPFFGLIDNCFVDYCPHWTNQWVIIRQ